MISTSISRKYIVKFPNAPLSTGRHHIHTPEHISVVHKFGAPFFKLDKVNKPRQIEENTIAIDFKCQTFGRSLDATMSSTDINNSRIDFNLKNKPFMSLEFNVEEINRMSHALAITISLYNPMYFYVVPLFPIFVYINKLEDSMFMNGDAKIKENVCFKMYRLLLQIRDVDHQLEFE